MQNKNRNGTRQTNGLTLDELYGPDEALDYINAALAAEGGRTLSLSGLKRHIYDDPERPGSLFQLEPIPVGRRVYAGYEKPMGIVFTQRMLDEYIANREHNAGHGVERRVTRPTAAERDAVLSTEDARAWLNDWFKRRGIKYRMMSDAFAARRLQGKIPSRVIGNAAVLTTDDMAVVAHDVVRQLRDGTQPRRGADKRPRRRSSRADARRRAILKWGGVVVQDER